MKIALGKKNVFAIILIFFSINIYSQNIESLESELNKLTQFKDSLENTLNKTKSEIKEIEFQIEEIKLKTINKDKFICNSITTINSKLKSEPKYNGVIIELIPQKENIKVLEYSGNNYWKILYKNKIGYLNEVLIKETKQMVLIKKSYNKHSKSTRSNYKPSGKVIHTGPRGGQYYINSNGNKTYIKRK